ncbi:MAG: phage tail protein [Burkholderia gladioli]
MNKIDSLRDAIVAAIPGLSIDPDRLLVFMDEGHIVATAEPSASFEFRYTARLVMLEFSGSTAGLMAAIVAWAHRNQPDLFQNPDNRAHGLTFEADMLSHESADLSIRVKLTESVVVNAAPDGTWQTARVDDSVPGNDDWDPAAWVEARDAARGAVPENE